MATTRTKRTTFRRAVLASVALHLALAGVMTLAVRSRPAALPGLPRIDTGIDIVVRMFDAGPIIEANAADTSPPPHAPFVAPTPSEPGSGPTPAPDVVRTPHATATTSTLSAETLNVISRSVAMRHVAASIPAVPPLHAAVKAGQSIVYILDCSGSMGEHAKLARARAALVATLKSQPENVRIQVIVYDGSARPLLPGTTCLPATAANVETVDSKLQAREAVGRSDHLEALCAAVRYRPDAILLLSDSNGLNRDQVRAALAQAEKPTYIYLARVTASKVEPPQELR